MLSETCVTSDIYESEIDIKGYNIVRCDSHSRHTGGAVIYVRKGIKYTETVNVVFGNSVWLLGIAVTTGFVKGFYGVLYHSPSASDADFLTFLESWCDDNLNSSDVYTIVGDFNIDMSKETTYSRRLKNIISANGLKQIVDTYTRVNENSKTQIDLVITNLANVTVSVSEYKVTDHETLRIIFQNSIRENVNQQKKNNKKKRLCKLQISEQLDELQLE